MPDPVAKVPILNEEGCEDGDDARSELTAAE